MRSRRGGIWLSLILASCAGDGGRDVPVTELAVQEAFLTATRYRVVTVPADGLDLEALMLGSTAAIVHYDTFTAPGGTFELTNATCGSTFISPHFAVTASHCVEGVGDGFWTDPGELLVEHIDVSAVVPSQVHSRAIVTGSWPSWSAGSSVSPPPGYARSRFHCRVACGRPATGAPACVSNSTHPDIALIECPERDPDFLDWWVYAGNTQAVMGAQVQSWWFHEILDLPHIPAPGVERWDHYGSVTFDGPDPDGAIHNDNFHYSWYQLLWPLTSDNNSALGPATVTALPPVTTPPSGLMNTSLFGCHGTSGSGIFARGSTTLYGPAISGPFAPSTLCGNGLNPMNVLVTNQLQNLTRVAQDRSGTYTPAF